MNNQHMSTKFGLLALIITIALAATMVVIGVYPPPPAPRRQRTAYRGSGLRMCRPKASRPSQIWQLSTAMAR